MRLAPLLLVLMLLSACGSFGGKTPEANVHSGTKGVVMTIASGSPPPKVFMGDPFSIIGTISDDGATDVDNGVLSIGIEDDFVSLDPSSAATGSGVLR